MLELMIVVVVIGILASIAYPGYQEQVRRSNRSEAKIALEQRAQALEKCYTRSMDFTSAACANAFLAGNTPTGRYSVAGAAPTATTFTLTATPQGGQASDAECRNFTINEAGARTVSGSLAATPERCWGR